MARIYNKLSNFVDKYEIGDILPDQKVAFSGTFSLSYLYWMMREWLIENDWVSRDESAFGETFYEQRETPAGDEVRFRWSHSKKAEKGKPGDANLTYELDIIAQVLFLKEAEIVVEGKKVKVNSGEIEIKTFPRVKFTGIEGDTWTGRMEAFIPFVFKKFHFPKIDEVKTALIIETDQFQNVLKTYFQMAPGSMPEFEQLYLTRHEGK